MEAHRLDTFSVGKGWVVRLYIGSIPRRYIQERQSFLSFQRFPSLPENRFFGERVPFALTGRSRGSSSSRIIAVFFVECDDRTAFAVRDFVVEKIQGVTSARLVAPTKSVKKPPDCLQLDSTRDSQSVHSIISSFVPRHDR